MPTIMPGTMGYCAGAEKFVILALKSTHAESISSQQSSYAAGRRPCHDVIFESPVCFAYCTVSASGVGQEMLGATKALVL